MGDKSKIEWTEATWNPWHGCHKISDGCKFCYMFRDKLRYGQNPNVVVRSTTTFNDPLKWKEPKMIFTCSWSDFFIKEADEWRSDSWNIIKNTPHHTYQILTKRPELIPERLPADWGEGYSNVWLMVSVENQEYVWRVEKLLDIPARVRGVSAEPLLGDINLIPYMGGNSIKCKCGYHETEYDIVGATKERSRCMKCFGKAVYGHTLDWVIVGGESGSNSRACDLHDIRSIVEQCKTMDVSVFVKQLGSNPIERTFGQLFGTETDKPLKLKNRKGSDINEFPEDIRIRQMPKVN